MERLAYRSVTDYDELRRLAGLQGTAWPAEMFTSAVHMKAAVLHGGSVIAVYDDERPAGFCYGFPAYDGKAPYLNSHMMVVHPDYRDRGLGTRLKLEQRSWAIERGYSAITWTFDPFQLRNGYLNICKLGGMVAAYMPAVYGTDQDADPSDRFLVRWELTSPRVCAAIEGDYAANRRWVEYAVLLGDAEARSVRSHAPIFAESGLERECESKRDFADAGYLLAVPKDAAGIKKRDPAAIVAWKKRLRASCERAFGGGYRIVGLIPGDESCSYYVLERADSR